MSKSFEDVTAEEKLALEPSEFLFDFNTKNSSGQSVNDFIRSFCKSDVFNAFSSYVEHPLIRNRTVSSFYEHEALNRFREIPCFESSRVRAAHADGHDYLHASWVDGFRETAKFIITQVPFASTTEQFWQMMWDQKSAMLVTLTELIDENKNQIVPRKSGDILVYGKMTIENLHCRRVRNSYDCALLKMQFEKENPRQVLLLSLHSWGVKGSPRRPTELLDLIADMNYNRELLRQQAVASQWLHSNDRFPVTLMCVSGVGRSCVVAALDILCRRLEASTAAGSPSVDVLDTLTRIRLQRAAALPKPEQYLFLSMSVLEFGIRMKLISNDVLNNIDLSNYRHDHQKE